MTANEMRDLFTLRYESGVLTNKQFNDREISLFLTYAQKKLIDSRVFPDGNIKQKGLESGDMKRTLDLSSLITANVTYLKPNKDFVRGTYANGALRNSNVGDTGITSGYPNSSSVTDEEDAKYGVFTVLASDVLYILEENVDISTLINSNRTIRRNVPVAEITHAEYTDKVHNHLTNPYDNLVWRKEHGNFLSSYTANKSVDYRASVYSRADVVNLQNVLPSDKWNNLTTYTKRVVQLIPGINWEIEKYNVYYIKQPRDIVVDRITPGSQINCELHPYIHFEIVDIAVGLAVGTRVPLEQKYQVIDKETKESQ